MHWWKLEIGGSRLDLKDVFHKLGGKFNEEFEISI